ncbi:MAG TPA: DUF1116 domain-containing protein [Chloroflexota bacterium]|nr:DUF1116 domain-containing protein [Chloroflexota bacterium]
MKTDNGGSIDTALFRTPLQVVNLGIQDFARELRQQSVPVAEVDWRPPAGGNVEMAELLKQLYGAPRGFVPAVGAPRPLVDLIDSANREVIDRIVRSQPRVVDVAPAREAMGLPPYTVLHSGPPISWERMCGPQKRGILGAILFEGWASDPRSAEEMVKSGRVTFGPSHEYDAVGPMTGIVSPSMPVLVVRNETFGNHGFATFNEGRGNVLWFGVCNEGSLDRLRWMRDTLGPAVKATILKNGPIDVFDVDAQGLQMGDECHARSAACTATLIKTMAMGMLDADLDSRTIASVIRFIADNSHFFLNFTMAAVKATMDAAHGVPYSTIVTAISRNGEDCMVRVSGLGDRWTVVPAARMQEALFYTGFSVADAAGDIGDSAIIETCGLGGMAIPAAPSMAVFVGGSLNDEVAAVRELRDITVSRHPKFTLPTMGFEQTPLGIDVRRVVETRTTPFITTGVLHESSETTGQIGTGVAHIPVEAFEQALIALAMEWGLATPLPEPTSIVRIQSRRGVQ